jgi:hypothetical protein
MSGELVRIPTDHLHWLKASKLLGMDLPSYYDRLADKIKQSLLMK